MVISFVAIFSEEVDLLWRVVGKTTEEVTGRLLRKAHEVIVCTKYAAAIAYRVAKIDVMALSS